MGPECFQFERTAQQTSHKRQRCNRDGIRQLRHALWDQSQGARHQSAEQQRHAWDAGAAA